VHDVKGEENVPTLTITRSQPFKRGLIVQFEELQDRDSAELWRGRYLLAPFSELPPLQDDEVYLHDLTGMKVVTPAGAEIGEVTTFYELPQGVMLDVNTVRGSVLIPYRAEIVVRTDLGTRTIVMDDKLGLLEDSSGSGQ
jgi:16S rRNA processing protein RimM